jgi:hypothetical protein
VCNLKHMHTRTCAQVLAARDEKMLQMQEQTGTLTAALVQMLQVCVYVCARVGLVWHLRLSESVHHVFDVLHTRAGVDPVFLIQIGSR